MNEPTQSAICGDGVRRTDDEARAILRERGPIVLFFAAFPGIDFGCDLCGAPNRWEALTGALAGDMSSTVCWECIERHCGYADIARRVRAAARDALRDERTLREMATEGKA